MWFLLFENDPSPFPVSLSINQFNLQGKDHLSETGAGETQLFQLSLLDQLHFSSSFFSNFDGDPFLRVHKAHGQGDVQDAAQNGSVKLLHMLLKLPRLLEENRNVTILGIILEVRGELSIQCSRVIDH